MLSIRHWMNICESPIGDIHTHGDFSRPGSLRADDLSLATPKRQDKIKRVLQNAPITIDLHFLNIAAPVTDRNGDFDLEWHLQHDHRRVGYVSSEDVAEWWTPINPRPNALNVLFVQNEGAERLPLTPWIIAHRISHAFYYAEMRKVAELVGRFDGMLYAVCGLYKSAPGSEYRVGGAPNFRDLAMVFGTTRATREGLMSSRRVMGEWYHDCFAQMCVTGDIRFNAAPDGIVGYVTKDPHAVDAMFARVRQRLLDGFRDMLGGSVGKILVF